MRTHRIYTIGREGKLEPLEEAPLSTEDELQALIATHPELLDGEQIQPGAPRRWLLITREQEITASPDGGTRWSLDHLIVDQDAIPTLAEMKRGASREIRRTIVGQLLEYAALAAETWTADTLRQEFEETALEQGRDPGIVLAELLQVDHDPDADKFWDQVATNLAARRLRLLFVADHIPEPLEQVVRFLNEQMPRIEVLAVEIKQYRGKVIHAVIPRVIGQTSGAPRPMTRNQAAPRVDLAPYREVLHTNQPGEMITWQLRADETIRRARRRLTLAAREEGLAIRHHQRLDQPQAIKLTVDGPVPPVPVATPEGT